MYVFVIESFKKQLFCKETLKSRMTMLEEMFAQEKLNCILFRFNLTSF
jgi:hypothetical protein